MNITNINITEIGDHPAVEFDIEKDGIESKGFEWVNKHGEFWVVERTDSNLVHHGLECEQNAEDEKFEYDRVDIFNYLDSQLEDLV